MVGGRSCKAPEHRGEGSRDGGPSQCRGPGLCPQKIFEFLQANLYTSCVCIFEVISTRLSNFFRVVTGTKSYSRTSIFVPWDQSQCTYICRSNRGITCGTM